MPDFHKYRDIPLDEAIDYFNDYYKRAKNTKEIKWYTYDLDSFINPLFNKEKIEKLGEESFTIIAQQEMPGNFRLLIYYNENEPSTILSDKQIKELQKFNNYLKTDEAVEYIISREKKMKILAICLLILFIFLYFKYIFIPNLHQGR